ncbi:MAG: hypothetical protein ABSH20_08255 [Tepidisphaeraceae bacterium]
MGQGGAVDAAGNKYFTKTWNWFARQTIDWFTQAARDHIHGTASEEREQRAIQVAGQAQLLLRRNFSDLRGLAAANAGKTPRQALAPIIEQYVRQVMKTPRYRPWARETPRGVQLSTPNHNEGKEQSFEAPLVVGHKVIGHPEEALPPPRPVDLSQKEDAEALEILRRYQPAMAKAAEMVLSGNSCNQASLATGISRDSIPRILTQIQGVRDYGVLIVGNKPQPFTRQTPGYQQILHWLETTWGRLRIGADNTVEAAAIARGELVGGKLYKWLLCQRCLELRDPDAIYRLLKRQPGCRSITRPQFKNKMEHAAKVFREEYAKQNAGQSPLDTTPGLRMVEDARRGSKGRRWSLDEPAPQRRETANFATCEPAPRAMEDEEGWRAVVLEDCKVSPADQAAFNIDFQRWLSSFDRQDRRIIAGLAAREDIDTLADRFGTTPSRVSELRRQFERSWARFQGTAYLALAASDTDLRRDDDGLEAA